MSEERTPSAPPEGDELEIDDLDQGDEPEVDEAEGQESGADPDLELEEEEEAERPATRRPGRRERQNAALRALTERVERQDRELERLRQTSQSPPRADPAELQRRDQAERDQARQTLSPDQYADWLEGRSRAQISAAFAQQERTVTDRIDKSSWDAVCRVDPMRARFRDKVEELVPQAPGVPRERLYHLVLGEETDRRAQKSGTRARRDAAARVAAQRTAPGSTGRGDVARPRTRQNDQSVEAARARLAGKAFW